MTELKFICPYCHKDTFIVEVEINVVRTTIFKPEMLDEDGVIEDYWLPPKDYGGDIDQYDCNSCGQSITGVNGKLISDTQSLYNWLLAQPYNAQVRAERENDNENYSGEN